MSNKKVLFILLLALDKRPLSCYIITMETITISPTKEASKRTKNRIRENGPDFQVMRKNTQHVFAIGCVAGSLLRSENGWLGWLPRSEFIIKNRLTKPVNRVTL